MKIFVFLFTLSFVSILLTGCGKKEWKAFVYPYGLDAGESTRIIEGPFDSIENCRDFAYSMNKGDDNFDYECGSDCEMKAIGIRVCDETIS